MLTAYLADTNVATRRVLTRDPAHAEIKRAVDALILRGETVVITAQNLVEFQALATRPLEANGLGMTSTEANDQARDMEIIFPLLEETPTVYTHWRTLMKRYDVRGRQVYDARLVAVMLAHGITHILTSNAKHFRQFVEITVVEPKDVPGVTAP